MLSAADLHRRGVEEINAGRTRRARATLQRARDRASDPELTARIEASLAYVVADLGDPVSALGLCDAALDRTGLRSETSGIVRSQRALLLMRAGETAAALADFAEAIAHLTASPADLGKAHLNRGGVYLQQQRPTEAARDFAAAAEELDRVGLREEAAKARHNRGYARLLEGDLVGALADMEAARLVLAPLSPVSQAVCDQDRAEVLMAAGLVDEGVAALRDAAQAYGTRRLRRRQAEAELVLARTLVDTDPPEALRLARASARRFRGSGAEAWRARAEAVAFAAESELGRVAPSLVDVSARLDAQLRAQGLHWAAASVRLRGALALARRRRREAADQVLRTVRTGPRAPLAVRLLDREVRSELAAARGRPANALQHVRAGLAELHAWQSSFGSLDLQTGVAGHGVRLGVRGLALAAESGRCDVLFEWSERARMLASRVQPVRAPQDPAIVADLAELREMARARQGARRTSPEREAELRQRVRERAWRHRGSGEVADPVTLGQLRESLGDDTALIAYVVTADRVIALVVTSDATSWIDAGDRSTLEPLLGGLLPDLDVAAAELAEPMAGFVRTELAERLAALGRVLVEPVLAAVGDRCVVLTPSGVLAGVPWTLLPGFVGRPVTVAQSATSWLARRTTPLRSASAGFVAGPRVARADDEVAAAAKEWPSATVLAGEDADAAAVSDLASSVDVLHVAAHGRHSAENPLFSGLQLADGPWFGYDIDQLRAVPDVVLLSACEVGRSNVRWGEELIGMTTAWLHAGSRCVIASPAAVNDRAAYDVLVAVHQQLAAGVDPAAALAAAVPAVSSGTAPVPLVCFG